MTFFRNLFKIVSASAALVLLAGVSLAYAQVNVSDLNSITGPFSENIGDFVSNRTWDVVVENNEDILRDFNTDVVTGENEIVENTLVGDEFGGDVDVTITGRNDALFGSLGMFTFPAFDMGDVTVTGGNSLTGPRSENENDVIANQRTAIDLINNSEVRNNVNFRAITGFNEIADNTSVGDVINGNVNVNANLGTGNIIGNGLAAFNAGGFVANDVNANFRNATTGPNSENINRVEANSEMVETVRNNLEIVNDLNFNVNAGNNEVSENTSVGNIRTGNVSINALVD